MRAVGEVMSIGKTYKEALQKAIRSLEIGRYGLGFAKDFNKRSLDELLKCWRTHQRAAVHHVRGAAQGADVEQLRLTHIKPWFIEQMKELVELEEQILAAQGRRPARRTADPGQADGFADRYLAQILGVPEAAISASAQALGVVEAGSRTRQRRRERGLLLLHLQRARRPPSRRQGRSWSWAAAPTASARASSSTTAACTPPSPCATLGLSPSWSTATRRRSRPTTTPPTSSTSSRSRSRTC
jgi:hypothetical protein